MKFATFSSTAALVVALLAASVQAGYPDDADGHFNRRLPAGGNGQGQGQGQGQGNGNGKPGADDDEIGVIVVWKNAIVSISEKMRANCIYYCPLSHSPIIIKCSSSYAQNDIRIHAGP